MSRPPRLPVSLVLVLLGAVLGVSLREGALAAPTDPDPAIRCRSFRHAIDGDVVVDTNDATSEVGQWVAAQRADTWRVLDVDFELTQKSTGFPQGYVQVCMTR